METGGGDGERANSRSSHEEEGDASLDSRDDLSPTTRHGRRSLLSWMRGTPQPEAEPKAEYPLDCNKYQIIRATGYDEVCRAEISEARVVNSLGRKEIVALRRVTLASLMEDENKLNNEVQQMRFSRLLQHPHLYTYDACFIAMHLQIPEMWCVGPRQSFGTISDLLDVHSQRGLPEAATAIILRDTLRGLVYLHKRGLVHNRICSESLVISTSGSIVISSFSNMLQRPGEPNRWGKLYSCPESYTIVPWLAPEVVSQETLGYTDKADIYSFGMLGLELLHGDHPYEGFDLPRVFVEKVKRYAYSVNPLVQCNRHLRAAINNSLDSDPDTRPSATGLMQSSAFRPIKKSVTLSKFLRNFDRVTGMPAEEVLYRKNMEPPKPELPEGMSRVPFPALSKGDLAIYRHSSRPRMVAAHGLARLPSDVSSEHSSRESDILAGSGGSFNSGVYSGLPLPDISEAGAEDDVYAAPHGPLPSVAEESPNPNDSLGISFGTVHCDPVDVPGDSSPLHSPSVSGRASPRDARQKHRYGRSLLNPRGRFPHMVSSDCESDSDMKPPLSSQSSSSGRVKFLRRIQQTGNNFSDIEGDDEASDVGNFSHPGSTEALNGYDTRVRVSASPASSKPSPPMRTSPRITRQTVHVIKSSFGRGRDQSLDRMQPQSAPHSPVTVLSRSRVNSMNDGVPRPRANSDIAKGLPLVWQFGSRDAHSSPESEHLKPIVRESEPGRVRSKSLLAQSEFLYPSLTRRSSSPHGDAASGGVVVIKPSTHAQKKAMGHRRASSAGESAAKLEAAKYPQTPVYRIKLKTESLQDRVSPRESHV